MIDQTKPEGIVEARLIAAVQTLRALPHAGEDVQIDPDKLPDTVVCYLDTTVALPLLCAYAFDRAGKRPLKRLYDRRAEMLDRMVRAYRRKVDAEAVTRKRKVSR